MYAGWLSHVLKTCSNNHQYTSCVWDIKWCLFVSNSVSFGAATTVKFYDVEPQNKDNWGNPCNVTEKRFNVTEQFKPVQQFNGHIMKKERVLSTTQTAWIVVDDLSIGMHRFNISTSMKIPKSRIPGYPAKVQRLSLAKSAPKQRPSKPCCEHRLQFQIESAENWNSSVPLSEKMH